MEILSSNPYFKHGHQQIKICVSGAKDTGHCGVDALDRAKELGHEIVRQGAVLVVGATTGFPLWVAMGVKELGGIVVGFSPASNEREHVEVYKLPVDFMDLIIYTGFGYSGMDLLLTRSADAVICGCGRIGTINQFTIALQDDKPLGIFEGPWDTGDELKSIVAKSHKENPKIITTDNAKDLVQKLIEMSRAQKINEYKK